MPGQGAESRPAFHREGHPPETLRKELDLVTAAASHIITKAHALASGEAHFHDAEEQQGEEQEGINIFLTTER